MGRFIIGAGLFLGACFLATSLSMPEPLLAADSPQVAMLRAQVQTLQASLNQAGTQNTTLQTQLTQANAKLKKAQADLDTVKKAPYVHTVVLKLKGGGKNDSNSTQKDVNSMLHDLPSLAKIPSVRALYYGTPAPKSTPEFSVKDFSLTITVLFDDFSGLKSYLEDPIHTKFIEKHLKENWEKPIAYDVQKPLAP
jgi:hypothetical protein